MLAIYQERSTTLDFSGYFGNEAHPFASHLDKSEFLRKLYRGRSLHSQLEISSGFMMNPNHRVEGEKRAEVGKITQNTLK